METITPSRSSLGYDQLAYAVPPKAPEKPPEISVEAIKEEIGKFNRHCSNLTYTMLGCLSGYFRAVVNDGTPGLGKSRSTVEVLKLLPRLTQVKVVQGHVSPSRLYQLLYESRTKGSVIVIDESATIIRNQAMQQLLRCTLYGGDVSWLGSKSLLQALGVPESFTFHGSVIFNTNLVDKELNTRALLDRVFYNRLMLSGRQVVDKLNDRHAIEPNPEVWAEIERRILAMRAGKRRFSLTEIEKRGILNLVSCRIIQIAKTYDANISMRILERVEMLCCFFKSFFGTLDFSFVEPIALSYFVINDEEDFLKKVLSECGGRMPTKDLAEIMSQHQRFSLRTAQRRITEYVDLGVLRIPKRGVVHLVSSVTPKSKNGAL